MLCIWALQIYMTWHYKSEATFDIGQIFWQRLFGGAFDFCLSRLQGRAV